MKIDKINSRNRRDIYADLICEHCGYIDKNVPCYDDSYFHEKVLPSFECNKCGKSSPKINPMQPKYKDSEIV